MCIVPLPAGMHVVWATARGNACRDLVARFGCSGAWYGEVDVVIRPAWRDGADGLVDGFPWFQISLGWSAGVGSLGERGKRFSGAGRHGQ